MTTTDKKPEVIADDALDAAAGGTETLTMNYTEVEWTYAKSKDGAKKGKVETTWKIEEGEK